jgi:hypothetical protein
MSITYAHLNKLRDQLGHGGIELGESEEPPVAQRREDPPLGREHMRFRLRLIGGTPTPGRHDGEAVVASELQVGAVDRWLVAAGLRHAAAKIVGTTTAKHPANASSIRTWASIHEARSWAFSRPEADCP